MNVRWAPDAAASARRYMHDQDGLRAIVAAGDALADAPAPAHGFHRGRYHRLRVGDYRILYVIDGDLITIERVDRVISGGLAHQPSRRCRIPSSQGMPAPAAARLPLTAQLPFRSQAPYLDQE